jgi:anti-sigma factor RsiW
MPQHLHDKIMDMISISEAAPSASPRHSMHDRMKLWGGMAAALMVGIGIHAGGIAVFDKPEKPGWIAQVANYQHMYVRDTVQMVNADPVASKAVMNQLYEQSRIRLDIPDMSALGLQFKRVQRLGYGDRPLVQMVYLPQKGGPVALCVIPENGPDVAPHNKVVASMDTVSWRRNGLAYVLLSDSPSTQLPNVGQMLYESKLPTWSGARAETENG